MFAWHVARHRRRMSARISTLELRVRYAETDQMGVVYHANYLVWCEIGRTEHIRGVGVSYAELERRGVALAVTDASVRYRAPARYDDPIRVRTHIAAVTSRTVVFEYAIHHATTDALLALATTTLVSLDRSGRVASLPPELRAALARDAGLDR